MLPTIGVDNSGSCRDADMHINIQIRDTIVIAPGPSGGLPAIGPLGPGLGAPAFGGPLNGQTKKLCCLSCSCFYRYKTMINVENVMLV